MRAILVTFALLLAGCAGDAPTPQTTADGPETADLESLSATDATGMLRCVVVDEAIIPLPDVMVFIDTGRLQHTDAQGRCGFDGLAPGPHMIRASKLGYHSTEVIVDVVAGDDDPDTVRIELAADPASTPRFEVYKMDGRIVCSTSLTVACGSPAAADSTGDSATNHFDIPGTPLWVTTDVAWRANSDMAKQMELDVGVGAVSTQTIIETVDGQSPLHIGMPAWTLQRAGMPDEQMFSRFSPIDIKPDEPVCTVHCSIPTVVLEQPFEVFVHAFYHFLPEEGWRFTDDGEPTLPP